MGNCIYCGQKAGFLKRKHKDCESTYYFAKNKIMETICMAITNGVDFNNLENEIKEIAETNFVRPHEILDLYTKGFDNAVDRFLDDGILSTEEEDNIARFKTHYKFDQEVIDKNGSLQKVFKASILREILDGKIPDSKLKIKGNLPFLLQKGERIIWIFQNVEFYEQKTRTIYQGKTQGVSIRIAKGLYYRTGSFKGNPVKIEEMKYISHGLVALTNRQLYFGSSSKNFKIPYNKLVTIEPYEDGVGLQKDGANTKPQVFKGLDGWFTYNLISNLNQL
jgi:hypothetical protein